MLRSRSFNETTNSLMGGNQGPVKRPAASTSEEPKKKRSGLCDLSNVMCNALHIDSAKVSKGCRKERVGLNGKENWVVENEERKILAHKISQKEKLAPVLENHHEDMSSEKYVDDEIAEQKVDLCPGFNFDLQNSNNQFMVPDYAFGIFQYYKSREKFFCIDNYVLRQKYLSAGCRAQLVDWMVELQQDFELSHETFYTAVKVLDHFLDKTEQRFRRSDLQLIGCSAIFIAAKFEEKFPPQIVDLVCVSDELFTDRDLKHMERFILKTVQFDLGFPLAYRFLRRFAKVLGLNMPTLTLARYYLETCAIFYEFVNVRDSLMGSACLLLALRETQLGDWNNKLMKYADYRLEEVEPLMWTINHALHMRPKLFPDGSAVFEKYSSDVFFEVATYPLLPDRFSIADPVVLPANSLLRID